MNYTIELVYTGKYHKTYYGSSSDDADFSEQIGNDGLLDAVLGQINDSLDGFIVDSLPYITGSDDI